MSGPKSSMCFDHTGSSRTPSEEGPSKLGHCSRALSTTALDDSSVVIPGYTRAAPPDREGKMLGRVAAHSVPMACMMSYNRIQCVGMIGRCWFYEARPPNHIRPRLLGRSSGPTLGQVLPSSGEAGRARRNCLAGSRIDQSGWNLADFGSEFARFCPISVDAMWPSQEPPMGRREHQSRTCRRYHTNADSGPWSWRAIAP